MKKRIVCALLALIMLVSLVPATALTASAASRTVSESAITVLKQLEGYSTECNSKGYTGYGTLCTVKGTHGIKDPDHTTNEKKADAALREVLADLDTAINTFATKNGLSLKQGQHDALVLFSFENGTAWTTGTGDFKAAVTSGAKGSEFLSAICRWNSSTDDDNRRMIEANMYLNGVYSASKPSQFIRVNFNLNPGSETMAKFDENGDPIWEDVLAYVTDEEGNIVYDETTGEPKTEVVDQVLSQVEIEDDTYMAQSACQYYDVSLTKSISLTPSNSYHYFLGWYTDPDAGVQVTTLNANYHNDTLYAHWQGIGDDYGVINTCYEIAVKDMASDILYMSPNGIQSKMALGTYVWVGSEYIDYNGQRWGGLVEMVGDGNGNSIMDPAGRIYGWVKLKSASSTGSSSANTADIDVTVTVTNSYVNRRADASIYSNKTGSYTQGTSLRIIDAESADGFLWGKVAASADDNTSVGWVALMYTNYDSVISSAAPNVNNSTVVATAVITYNGYVNVRSDAGISNQIVGALACGTEVNLYETKYVNGIQWGRCASGWFCLTYANVTRLVEDTSYTTDTGYLSYVFTGKLNGTPYSTKIYTAPGDENTLISNFKAIEPNVTVSNLTRIGDITWGKIAEGWVKVSDENGTPVDVILDLTTYTVSADSLTVRESAGISYMRKDTLSKGVQFNVNETKQVVVVGDSVWGFADKVGEGDSNYGGWVNLATKYVSRTDMPTVSTGNAYSGTVGTIVGADSVRVRMHCSLSGTVLGSIARGTTVNILGEENGWYKIDYEVDDNPETDSWVYGQYVEISEGSVSGSGNSATAVGAGIIANTYGGVNLRTNPGTGSTCLGKIAPGTVVYILEVTTYGSAQWGRVENGWICMDYVQLLGDLPDDVLASLGIDTGASSNGSSANGSASGAVSSAEVAIYTGTVSAEEGVNVYKTTSEDSDVVHELTKGDNITMHEILTVTEKVTTNTKDSNTGATITTKEVTSYWARVNDGYIKSPGACLDLDPLDEATYTVTESNTLNVRDNPGTDGTSVQFKLAKYDQVAVTQLKIVNGSVWGYVECDNGVGWASLAYMTKGTIINTEASTDNTNSGANTTTGTTAPVLGSTGNATAGTGSYIYTGKVINTNSLNVRSTPSTGASKTTTLSNGASLVIYETVINEYMAWGRCDAGWVYLYYVDMTPVNGAVDARVVYTDNTVIYSDSSCSEVVGTYSKMAVIDIYEIVGNMVRTDLGWVSTENLM